MAEEQQSRTRKTHCTRCGGVRNCDILGHHAESEDEGHFAWHKDWYLLRCRGCDYVFAETVYTDSEDLYYENGPDGQYTENVETVRTWPARGKRDRPDWFKGSVTNLRLLDLWPVLREVYEALDADLNVLAAMGMRIAFDRAAELRGVDPAISFEEKLKGLFEKKADRDRLETLVEAGSASAHRGWRPETDDLNTMMDVLEQFVHEQFVAPVRQQRLDKRVAAMKAKVPPRQKRAKKPPAKGESASTQPKSTSILPGS